MYLSYEEEGITLAPSLVRGGTRIIFSAHVLADVAWQNCVTSDPRIWIATGTARPIVMYTTCSQNHDCQLAAVQCET